MLAVQQAIGNHDPSPIMMWNPPWVLPLLAPVLSLPFSVSALGWFIISIVLLLASAVLISRVATPRLVGIMPIFLGAAIMPPVWQSLALGQLSLVFTFGLALFLWAAHGPSAKRDFLAGCGLTLLTFKPHLFLLVGVSILAWIIYRRRLMVLVGLTAGLSVLIAVTALINPTVFAAWFSSLTSPARLGYGVNDWQVATLSGFLRGLLAVDGHPPGWPSLLLPLAGVIAVATALAIKTKLITLDLINLILPLSLFLAPFGWYFDFSLLLIPQVWLLVQASGPNVDRHSKTVVFSLMLLFQLLTALSSLFLFQYQHQLFWYPPAFLAVYLASRKAISPALNALPDRNHQ